MTFAALVLALRFLRPQLWSAFDDPVHPPVGDEGGAVPPAPAGSAV